MLKPPFPYFGGKRRVAAEVWRRFGDVKNYVEPFCGSAAVLLSRPTEPRIETINDLDGYIANFWRATQHDPAQVAAWADWPINEVDLHSRHRWLMQQDIRDRLFHDPHFYDCQIAGWWVWGQSAWLGSGWCKWPNAKQRPNLLDGQCGVHRKRPYVGKREGVHRKRPHLVHGERGVHTTQKIPHLVPRGRGVHRQIPMLVKGGGSGVHRAWQQVPMMNSGCGVHRVRCDLAAYFQALADRLGRVRVCCGDWSRVCTHCVTDYQGLTAVFLDPPYGRKAGRDNDLYATDSLTVADEVRRWAVEHGESDQFRIALCGLEGEHQMPASWSLYSWASIGGYGKVRENRSKERIWFSPHCLGGESEAPAGRTTFLPTGGGAASGQGGPEGTTPEQVAQIEVGGVSEAFGSEQKEDKHMAMQTTEAIVQTNGQATHPQNGSVLPPATSCGPDTAATVGIQAEAVPDESWPLERLAQYAATGIADARSLCAEAVQMRRKSTVQVYRAGRALFFARQKLKAKRAYRRWLRENNIPPTTAWEATELFEKAPSERAITGLTRSQAKKKYGVVKERKVQHGTVPNGVAQARKETGTAAEQQAPALLNFPAGQHDGPEQLIGDKQVAVAATAGREATKPDAAPQVLSVLAAQQDSPEHLGENGPDHEQANDPLAEPPHNDEDGDCATATAAADLMRFLVVIVDRLEWLERDVANIDWNEAPGDDFSCLVERGAQVFQRLRARAGAA